MKKTLRKCMAMFMASICLLMTFTTSTVFAAESDADTITLGEDNSTEDSSEVVVEEIDPNIEVIITRLPDDYSPIETYDLRKTTTTFSYRGNFLGKWRYYKGNHFSVDLTTSSSDNGNFTLELQRFNGNSNAPGITVKKATIPQNGSFHVEFLNVNKPGTYAFGFSQPLFHQASQSGSMTIWDWD